jgi:hypothetical protein
MIDIPLPLEFPEPVVPPTCWYCGATSRPFEQEHQLPRSRGGGHGLNIVRACVACNDVKGPLTVEEFREGLAERLGLAVDQVVFAGEATPDHPATQAICSVRSLAGDRSAVGIDPEVADELYKAWLYLRTQSGNQRLTRRELASTAIAEYLRQLRKQLGVGEAWPEMMLSLFPLARPSVTGRADLAQTPRVPMDRQHTKVPGDLLDHARAGVEHRRSHGEPELTLLDWMAQALQSALQTDAAQFPDYPTRDEALARRYGARPQRMLDGL